MAKGQSDVVHYPLTTRGKEILNSFGVVIARCMNEATAHDIALRASRYKSLQEAMKGSTLPEYDK